MPEINLITSPDRILNNSISFLLVYPSKGIKEQFNNLIKNFDESFNIYLYENPTDDHQPDWLLTTAKLVDYCIIDLDNCPQEVRDLGSYFVSQNNTYWLTNGEEMFYNKLSNKRIYSLDYFIDKIGGQIEEKAK